MPTTLVKSRWWNRGRHRIVIEELSKDLRHKCNQRHAWSPSRRGRAARTVALRRSATWKL